ncbi:protein HGV2 isoform X2 [Lepeophtheirus salmonis]|uniref:protein HGV2 isoform X2 n=1 Tax=Lepeophtheirus salmonis TaxID=72036 RepID=UPI001AE285F0|nr:nuclear autoantigenic sperm protein-like isoform X2 [Lepeophtheirus salmonis]
MSPHPPSDTPVAPSKCPGPSPSKKEAEVVSKAMEFLISGKRNLLVQDVSGATTALEEACKLLGQQFGETGRECGEAYFYYGKALLELARMESGVIDNAFDGESEDSKEDEDEDEESEDKDEESEDKDEESEDKDEESEDKDEAGEKSEKKMKDEETKETESIGSNDAGSSEIKDVKDKDAVEKEEEEDPSNLQLSWEMLELAKSIFQKHADSIENPKDDKRIELETKLCEVYQLLGEVSIENENYEQAVEDLNSCLRRREELLPSDSRSIAETHYQLGVALGFNLRFDDAVKALESSISVLNSRVQKLESKSESQDPSKKDDAFYTREREIEEIKKLIPEIKEKIVDTRDMQEETKKKIKEGGLGAFESSSPSNSDKDKPVTNITNLVKKRKKSGENANGDEPTKKPHLEENGTNGVKTSNGNSEAKTNGKVETSA